MRLGLFIAKTLLERSGGQISFANGRDSDHTGRRGAIVKVSWPNSALEIAGKGSGGLGENQPIPE